MKSRALIVADYINMDWEGKPIAVGIRPDGIVDVFPGRRVVSFSVIWAFDLDESQLPEGVFYAEGPLADPPHPVSVTWLDLTQHPTSGVVFVGLTFTQLELTDSPDHLFIVVELGTIRFRERVVLNYVSAAGVS